MAPEFENLFPVALAAWVSSSLCDTTTLMQGSPLSSVTSNEMPLYQKRINAIIYKQADMFIFHNRPLHYNPGVEKGSNLL